MSNVIMVEDSSKRIYDKVKKYENENLIKCSFWYTQKMESIFNSDEYETVIDNYIAQLEKAESIFYPFEEQEDLKSYLLEEVCFEDFTNLILRYTYKRMKADVFSYDELENDDY